MGFTPLPERYGRKTVDEWQPTPKGDAGQRHARKPMVTGFTYQYPKTLTITESNTTERIYLFILPLGMQISWLGISAVRITTRPANEDVVVLCDPYDPHEVQAKRGKMVADIVTVSVPEHPLHSATQEIRGRLEKPPFIIDTPGECEVNGVIIYGVPAVNTVSAPHKKVTLYMIETEGLSLLHLGFLGQKTLTDAQLERFEHVDVLFVPVGDPASLEIHDAVAIVNQIEPRIVIPVAYHTAHIGVKLLGAEKFIKELGLEADEPATKIKLAKKDLPAEETKLMLLEPE